MTPLFCVHKDQHHIAIIKPNPKSAKFKWRYSVHHNATQHYNPPLCSGFALTYEDASDMVDLFLSEQRNWRTHALTIHETIEDLHYPKHERSE
tara:strand:- start:163 stop:441 length:279 start_codon:yes stop_codon:yes gene_type:complete